MWIVAHSALDGLQLPSPVGVAVPSTRKTAVLWSESTPRKTKNGRSIDGSGVSRATSSRDFSRPVASPKRSDTWNTGVPAFGFDGVVPVGPPEDGVLDG